MPEWFDFYANRLDHFVSAFSSEKVNSLNLGQEISMSVQMPSDQFWLSMDINGVRWRMYHIPFLQKFHTKYDSASDLGYDTGLKSNI